MRRMFERSRSFEERVGGLKCNGGSLEVFKTTEICRGGGEPNEATSTIRPEHAILRKPAVLSAEWKTMEILIGDSRASVRTYTHTHTYIYDGCASSVGGSAPSRFTPTLFGNLSGYEITSYLISRPGIFREEYHRDKRNYPDDYQLILKR